MLFQCSTCACTHQCGSDVCQSIFYNSDHTKVCSLTGLCFEQRLCDQNAGMAGGISNSIDTEYHHRVKRNHQVKNKSLRVSEIAMMIGSMDFLSDLSRKQRTALIDDIRTLWDEFIDEANKRSVYIHRKDSRCFLAAVTFGLSKGISSTKGFVVHPHGNLVVRKLNKKKDYKTFKISDIRHGQKLIKIVFDNHTVLNTVRIIS